MMKRFILMTVALLVAGASLQAQTALRTKRYKGFLNVDLSMVSIHERETGGGSSSSSGFGMSVDWTTSHGAQVCPYLFVGAGLGFRAGFGDEASVLDADFFQMPLFLQVRGNLTRKPITPYLDFKGGYAAGDMNGAFLSPALGVSVPVCKRLAMNFELAYRAQSDKSDGGGTTWKTWRHMLDFGIGIEF